MRRVLAYIGMTAVAVAAAILSFDSLWGLARLAGIHWPWLLPVAIDAYALTATQVWWWPGLSARTHDWARANALVAIALSILGNAAYHGFTQAGIRSLGPSGNGWIVAVIVAAVAPAALYACAHLWSLVSSDPRSGDGAGPVTDPVPASPEVPAKALVPAGTSLPSRTRRDKARTDRPAGTGSPSSTSGQAREYARTRYAAGDPVKAPDLTREFPSLDPSLARRIVREVTASSNGHVPEPVA